MSSAIFFDPLIDIRFIAVLALIMAAVCGFALWRGLSGWWLRTLGAGVILATLMGPVLQREDREDLADIVLLLEDQTASQQLADRATRSSTAANALAAQLEARRMTEVRRIKIGDAEGDQGGRVRMDDGSNVVSRVIDRLMKWKLRGSSMMTKLRSVGCDTYHVVTMQVALVDGRWRNPDLPFIIANRKIAP